MPNKPGSYRVKVYRPTLNRLGIRDKKWCVEITADGEHYWRYPFYSKRSAVKAVARFIRTRDTRLWMKQNLEECS